MISEKKLIEVLDLGVDPKLERPFLKLAQAACCTEEDVLEGIKKLKNEGKIKRFGLVVKNRSIGFVHNAMVTLDIADEDTDRVGALISAYPFVKLCYLRQRKIPDWRFNLYFMIHGKNREIVLEQLSMILRENHLLEIPKEILFSKQCLKQKGASYH